LSSHILAPVNALVRSAIPAAMRWANSQRLAIWPERSPARHLLDGLTFEVTPGMRGKPLAISDADGNLVAVTGRRRNAYADRMIG
jgi:hypothetical protein